MRFDPDELLRSGSRKFPVYIDGISVNNILVIDQNLSNISLKPGQNNLQFSFIGLDPDKAKNIEYSYQLAGADKDWISNNTTIASYNNLGPGDYSFNVRARHKGDTEWMALSDPFRFTIETPWYKTWWFRVTLAAAVVALVWFLIRSYYRGKLLRQKAMMEKELAIEQERTKMARELHDGLGSMLSGIKHSFTAMTKDLTLNDKQQLLFHSNLDKLNESIRELRNISHNMASDTLVKFGLENSLRDYCSNVSINSGIPVSFTAIDTKDLNIGEERSVHIFRVIQELFQNIIKHADAGSVVVQISNNNKQVYLTVEDDGKGFDLLAIKKQDGIGLKNIESRIRLLKGALDYKTAPGKGTSVMIIIPIV
jgi:signal transduction histidine kinase